MELILQANELPTVHKVNNRNAKAIEATLADIRKQFTLVEKLLTVVKVVLAR